MEELYIELKYDIFGTLVVLLLLLAEIHSSTKNIVFISFGNTRSYMLNALRSWLYFLIQFSGHCAVGEFLEIFWYVIDYYSSVEAFTLFSAHHSFHKTYFHVHVPNRLSFTKKFESFWVEQKPALQKSLHLMIRRRFKLCFQTRTMQHVNKISFLVNASRKGK